MEQVAAYARVSTRRQEQEGTIASQIAKLSEYAQSQGWQLASEHIFKDEAVSGQQLARPGLDRLRDVAALGTFRKVLCLSPDRLARDLAIQQIVLYELRRQGVEVCFLNQPQLGDDLQSQFWQEIQAVIAKLERGMIQDRMRRGRLYRLRQGSSLPTQAPYGYRYRPSQAEREASWEVSENEAAVVEQVFTWYTEEGETLGQLARRLNAQKTPTPEGSQWTAGLLSRLLRYTAYKGVVYYNRRRSDASGIGERRKQGRGILRFPRYVERPAEEWIPITVPALVTEERWQAAQERLEMNARFGSRNSQRTYLLRSLLVCGVCGHTLQGRTQGKRVTYQCVYGGKHCPPDVPHHTCRLVAEEVEALVWQALADLLAQPEQIEAAWHALSQSQTSVSDTEHSTCQRRYTDLTRRRQRLLDAYEAGLISLTDFQERCNRLAPEMDALQQRLAQPQAPTLSLDLDSFTQHIRHALAATDVETKQEVLRLLIERIVVSDEALTIEHVIPTIDSSRLSCTHHAPRTTLFTAARSATDPRACQNRGSQNEDAGRCYCRWSRRGR